MRLILVTTTLAMFTASVSAQETLPNGWRLPTPGEVDVVPMRNWDESKFLKVEGDFNSDGISDIAQLVKSDVFEGEGFAVLLSSESGHQWQIVDSFEYKYTSTKPMLKMGLSLVKPGEYRTACGKGYWECNKGEPEVLELKSIGLAYFLFESASSIWFWDQKTEHFVQVWISD